MEALEKEFEEFYNGLQGNWSMKQIAAGFAQKAVNAKLEEAAEIIKELEPYNPKHIEPDSQLDQFDVDMINKRWERFQEVKQSILSLKTTHNK